LFEIILFDEKITKPLIKPGFCRGIGTRLYRRAQLIDGLSPHSRR
jgi:hypothetical protein